MLFVFTCACGNALEVEAPDTQLGEQAIQRAGWVVEIKYYANGRVKESYKCEGCKDERAPRRGAGQARHART
jgi:hypothetical protein